jgi:N-acyl-D-aspartate/D-glutamate deacylase
LTVLLPPWAFEGGGKKLIERLKDPETRQLIKKQMAGLVSVEWPRAGSSCLMRDGHYDKVYLAESKKNTNLCGKSMYDIARMRGTDPLEVVLDLLLEEGETTPSITAEAYSHENNSIVLSHPTSMVASDGSAYSPHGEMGNVLIHPRSYGCFPNIFVQYVQERKLLTLESAIRKMTSLPAQRLGLRDRGLLRTGMWADMVVFDPRSIESVATYEDPHQYPKGIDYVLVNGELAVSRGDPTGNLAGKILRHNMK